MFRSSMARKGESLRAINVAVVGLSGTEKEKGQAGVGKSCLCNRFMRSLADDYSVDHISVLSQTDFSGRVVNNDHFLYWGDVVKPTEEGQEVLFQVIEQTEFIDDASFQPFKGGKMEPYMKRCSNTKLTSAEKLMYICKNQLGIEKEYEQKVIPDGKFNVDGFLCLFDVSVVPSRSIEKQTEVVAAILNNIMKTKKPVILVTTKNDDANEAYVKEAEKLVNRKEYKGTIPMVETSAHENINVDSAFVALAQLIDRSKGRMKVVPFIEAARARKEVLDQATEVFQRLIRAQVTDYRAGWVSTSKKLTNQPDFVRFVDQFGMDSAHRLFRRHVKKLKDEYLAKRVQGFMEMLPEVLQEMIPDLNSLQDSDWPSVQQHIKDHPDFTQNFYECPDDLPWTEGDFDDPSETRIPFDVLDTTEAETVFKNHVNALQQEQKRLELPKRWKKQFKQLLEDTGYVTPGKLLSEVRVLFMGRECFEALSDQECQAIYDRHQKEIVEKAKHNFQELLLEHADLFYHFKSIAPTGTITQDDIKEITDALQEDSRYKSLDRLDQDRKLMLFQHLGFVHCPIREHCPAFPNCMDALIERILANKAHRPSSWNHSSQWLLSSDNNQLNLVILGIDGLADELVTEIRTQCDDDEYEIDCQLYSLDYRIIDGDVSLPQNSFKTSDFVPHGCFCVYSNPSTFEYVRESLEKTLLSNLEQDDRLPFQGLPIVILFVADPSVEEKEVLRLREEGQSLADSLQCPFIDVTMEDMDERFNANLVADGLRQLILSIHHRAGFINVFQSVMDGSEPDIRIIMCMFCGDPYSVENVLGPLLNHQCCFLSGERSIILETFLGDSKRKVEVIISSYHGANAFRDDLVHGFILVYSTKRKASLATLNAFSMNIPNLPIQIMAVTDSGGANAFFSSDLSHLLMTEGNAIADRLQAHFMTSSSSCQQKTAFYTPFFKEVWDKKPEIEQAFNMEEPPGLSRSAECTLEVRPGRRPRPPPRLESYHCKGGSNDGSGSEIYERLPTDASQGDDINLSPSFNDRLLSPSDDSDIYSHVDMYSQENGDSLVKPSDIKNAKMHQGFQVYPPPTTPPEPAPPDHPPRHRLAKATTLPSGSHTSLDEITSDISGSRESLATRDSGWVDDSVFLHRTDGDDGMWMNNYAHRAFTTGRRHVAPPKTRPKGNSHTLKQPGKLNLEEYSLVTDAIARMNVKGKESKLVKSQRPVYGHHAPLAREENMDVVSEYAQVKDAVPNLYSSYDGEYTYTLVQDAVGNNKAKVRHRREKGRPAFSESDSDWSSPERKQRDAEAFSKASRKPTPHKRVRKKRTPMPMAIPVPTPRVPNMQSFAPDGAGMLSYRLKDDKSRGIGAGDSLDRANSESPSDASDASDPDMSAGSAMRPQTKLEKHSFRLKKRTLGPAPRPPVVPNPPSLDNDMFSPSSKMKLEGSYGRIHDDESSLDVSSPRDVNSPLFGMGSKMKDDDKLNRRKEKQRAKDDEKLEKKRQKEVKKQAEKEKEREKKKIQKQQQKQNSVTKQLSAGGSSGVGSGGSGSGSGASVPTLQDFVQSEDNAVPLLLEKCVKFIEEEGLDSEGIYRVPGNRAHVDLLFQKFEEDQSVDIHELDIPVNAVATALKDFFSKRLPPLFTQDAMKELEDISVRGDRSCRLLALRSLLKKMPDVNFEVLKFIFQHFVRVSENCKLNSMDSKNLAICWWPTLLPIEFSDMGRFEARRPHLEDVVQTMIDQYPFLFCGKEAFVMV